MIDCVVTAYGTVTLSPKVLGWLDTVHPKWREFQRKKRKSQEYKAWRRDMDRLETFVSMAAEIEWVSGGLLEVV